MADRDDVSSDIDLLRIEDQAHVLRDRLHRVVVALAMTEELHAVILRRLAAGERGDSHEQMLRAKFADRTAEECREFGRRLEE